LTVFGKRSLRSLIDLEGIGSLFVDTNIKVTALLLTVRIRFIDIGSIIIDLSDSDLTKIFPKFIEKYEENAIIIIF
jgi:hypothetical protein